MGILVGARELEQIGKVLIVVDRWEAEYQRSIEIAENQPVAADKKERLIRDLPDWRVR